MQPDTGKIYEGKVTGITNFGAFVELEPGTTGMVHISEVANSYVSEIRDFLTVGQSVKVKVLSVGTDGKISLSIKKAAENVSSWSQSCLTEVSREYQTTAKNSLCQILNTDCFIKTYIENVTDRELRTGGTLFALTGVNPV
jgi:predicted RNA-binding protein with RPS1 domain